VSLNPRQALVYFSFHCSTRGVGSRGAMCSLYLTLYAIMFIELCLIFVCFCVLTPQVVSYFFLSHL
jgi:hypothetical protein